NVVVALRPPDPLTWTSKRPSWSAAGKSWLMSRLAAPSGPVTGVTRAVRLNVCGGTTWGGLLKGSVTVTGARGAKPLARTTQAVKVVPRLCLTMHAAGPPPTWPDEPHTVFGAAGGPPGGRLDAEFCELELLRAEPRTTPTTTRA